MPGMLPAISSLYADPLLSNMSIGFALNGGLVADAFPFVSVDLPSGKYILHDQASVLRRDATPIAPGTPPGETDFNWSQESYLCVEKGVRNHCDPRKLEAAQAGGTAAALDRGRMGKVMNSLLIEREIDFATTFLSTNVWTANTEQTGKSTNPSTNEFLQFNDDESEPLLVIAQQVDIVESKINRRPNTMIMGAEVATALKVHPDIKALLPDNGVRVVSDKFLSDAFEIPNVRVARASYNSAVKGQAVSMSRMVGKCIWIGYVAENPAMEEPSAGYTFSYTPFDQVKGPGAAFVARYDHWDTGVGGNWIDGRTHYGMAITCNSAGVFLASAVA